MAILEAHKGKSLIASYFLNEDFLTIGRAGNNEIVLPDQDLKVSRYHAALIKNPSDPTEYILRDLSSTWGTKIGKEFIFQAPLHDGDVITIADFGLRYKATGEDKKEPFKIINEDQEIEPFSLPADVGDQETSFGERDRFTKGLENLLGTMLPDFSGEIQKLFEEILGRLKTSAKVEEIIEGAMNLLFYALSMKEGCSGCLAIFEGEENFRYLITKGMETQFSIPLPRQVIEEIHKGRSISAGNHLWVPLFRGREIPEGFLFLGRGPYAHPFGENEIKLASYITRIIAEIIEHIENVPWSKSDFIKWPRMMVGANSTFKEVQRIASLESNVLLLGNTGAGKEVAAMEIHQQSKRKDKAFRVVNCPGIPYTLLEDALFGHKKGAFTGAIEDKKGEIELAEGGTVFLDEIADLSTELQSKLLRFIVDKTMTRVGEAREKRVDVRIIAATSHNLQKDMEEGEFRRDLYYRFGTRISIPPLNERKKDIPLLAHYFLDKYAAKKNLRWRGITSPSMRVLLSYPWPGNVRELESCIENALSKSDGVICLQHLPEEFQHHEDHTDTERMTYPLNKGKLSSLEDMEKAHLMEILNHTVGNKARAAQILKISKPALYHKMKRFGIAADFGKWG